jgi:type I restriction enzyme M protein
MTRARKIVETKSEVPVMKNAQDLYQFIYKACDYLRGPVGHESFKDYITPLLYYKRLSDVWDEEYQNALTESGGDEEYAQLPEQHLFVIPEGCHWEDIRTRGENLGSAIVEALRLIEQANPETLYGVLSAFSTANFTDKTIVSDERFRNLIEHLSQRRLGNKDYSADLMGDAYEILLKKFADESKAKAGEFYTPRPVVKLLVRILDPQPGERVYDPACGSGGMLIEAVHHTMNSKLSFGRIFGQEQNPMNAAIAKMNLFLHGASDFHILQGDTLGDPRILQGGGLATFDCVIANPPFSLANWGAKKWANDPYGRNIWGTPPASCGDYAWIQHMVKSMRPGRGRMAVVLPQGVLFRGNEEGRIRQKLVESDLIEAVVTLGDNIFYGTNLSPCFLVLRWVKPRERVKKVIIIDGSKIMTQKRAQNVLSEENVERLYELYAGAVDVEDFCRVVGVDEIAANGYDLSVNKYVKYHAEAVRSYAEVAAAFAAARDEVAAATENLRTLLKKEGLLK